MDASAIQEWIELDFDIGSFVLVIDKEFPEGYRQKVPRINHSLAYVVEGKGTYQLADSAFKVEKGCIQFFPKGSRYTIHPYGEKTYRMIVVNFEFADNEVLQRLPVQNSYHPKDGPYFDRQFHEIFRLWSKKGLLYRAKCKGLLQEILCTLFEGELVHELNTRKMPRLKAAVDYMEAHFSQPIKIGELADLVSLSDAHFRAQFHQVFGTSPAEYLQFLRMNRAKDLINSQAHTISEIATLVGYSDVFYFSRVFKKYTGVSPTQY